MTAVTNGRRDARENRERILEAARAVFAAHGLDAEMRDIADRAGVGVGTLYRHFESRDGLLGVLIQETQADLIARARAAVESASAADALRAIVRAAAEVMEQFGALTETALRTEIQRHGEPHLQQFDALLRDLVGRGIEDGTFRTDVDAGLMAATLEALFVSGKFIELARERGYRGAAEQVADFVLRAGAPDVCFS